MYTLKSPLLKTCKDIAIIVPVKNNQKGVEKLLTSFFQVTDRKYYPKEFIFVDNNSDQLLAIPDHFLQHELAITVLTCKKPGPGNARDMGVSLAYEHSAKWLHFIDSDCLFTPTTLSGFLSHAEDNILAYQGTVNALGTDWLSKFYDENATLCPPPVQKYDDCDSSPMRPFYIVTCNALVYFDAFIEIGGFDDAFNISSEDVDLGLRLSHIGQIAYAPSSRALHDFLGGSKIVKAFHILELINRIRKYGQGEKPILKKYGHLLSDFENSLNKDVVEDQTVVSPRFLKLLTGMAFAQGIIQADETAAEIKEKYPFAEII